MLEHIYQVRNKYDERDSKEKKISPTATRKLYHKFLFYENFVALERALVIPEGKTDTIYLKAAIERLPAFQLRLGKVVDSVFRHALQFQRFSSKVAIYFSSEAGPGTFSSS